MTILLFFAFVSGLVTILAPCIWPLLPIVLSASTTGGRQKSLGITLGIMSSFLTFTLSVSYLVKLFHFDPNILRLVAVIVISFLGLTLLVPWLSQKLEGLMSRISGRFTPTASKKKQGFLGGYLTGLVLGVVWSPCAGPILATIATLAATTSVNFQVILVTLSYVVGLGIPLFLFSQGSAIFFTRTRFISRYTGRIQQIFGAVMILTALAIFTNYDKVVQVKLLEVFPSFSNFLYGIENNQEVQKQLNILKKKKDEMKREMPKVNLPGSDLPNLGPAPEFVGIAKWLNAEKPIRMADLRANVVLIDFWTYTCINCVRTLPHVTGWYEKYKDRGFVVVGVHTPEFEFEKNTQNVINAIQQYGIHYPVAQDNTYSTWNAYDNHYWPAKYLVDVKGNIRYIHFGEGEYEQTEKNIQLLLNEAGRQTKEETMNLEDQTPITRLTPETYLGAARRERFTSDKRPLSLHQFKLEGIWDTQEEYAIPKKGAALELRFFADKVFIVITPKTKPGTFQVFLDGKIISKDSWGKDAIGGRVTLDVPRLYNLIDLHGKNGDHILRLQFETDGTRLYAFTFG